MSLVVVGVGDCAVSKNCGDVLVTYALGSCIAVTMYDSVAHVGGLLHFMLPESKLDPAKAVKKPFMFADTGLTQLLKMVTDLGAVRRRLRIMAVGGAQVMGDNGFFEIGRRNHAAVRGLFWRAGLLLHAEEIGGAVSRTVRLELENGNLWIRPAQAPEFQLMPKASARTRRESPHACANC